MTVEEFVTTLRELRNREPFEPFAIELNDGTAIDIDEALAFGFVEGEGTFITPDYRLLEFSHDKVRTIRMQESAST